jgi:hypothetical protein
MQMKQPAWESMPVLNVRVLPKESLALLSQAYEAIASKELSPVGELDEDAVRIQIDDALSKVLGLPSLSAIRELLAREPGLSASEINPAKSEEVEEIEALEDQAAMF